LTKIQIQRKNIKLDIDILIVLINQSLFSRGKIHFVDVKSRKLFSYMVNILKSEISFMQNYGLQLNVSLE